MRERVTKPTWAAGPRYTRGIADLREAALKLVPYEYGYPGHSARPRRPGDPAPPTESRHWVVYRFQWRAAQFALDMAIGSGPAAFDALRAEVRQVLADVPLVDSTREQLLSDAEYAMWTALRFRR